MYVWQIQGILDFLMLAGKAVRTYGAVCSSPADLGKLDKAVHLSGHGVALCVFWICHPNVQVEISPHTSLSSVLVVTGASGHIILLQNKKTTYESSKKCCDGADT